MKLISITIQNLASLNDVSIDFEKAPLEHAGIFAITGDTGAGKSTILDAMCLALYGKTARLKNDLKNKVNFNGDEIKLNDPRNLLRRGCVNGSATLKFIAKDNKRYQAKWSVSRARNKITGNLKANNHELIEIDTETVIAQKSNTVKVVSQIIGLNFEQFTRAVLLAQHDFSAFLKASSDERAQLLECLTGTLQFSELGQAIYEKHKEKKHQLEQQKAHILKFDLLSKEELRILNSEILKSEQVVEDIKASINEIEQNKRWLIVENKLLSQIKDAELNKSTTIEKITQSRSDFEYAEQANYVQNIKDNRTQFNVLTQQIKSAEKQFIDLQKINYEHEVSQKQQKALDCRSLLSSAKHALETAQPHFKSLREYDKNLSILNNQLDDIQVDKLRYTEKNRQHKAELEKVTEQHQNNEDQQVSLQTDLSKNKQETQLLNNWSEFERSLSSLINLNEKIQSISEQLKSQEATFDDIQLQLQPLDLEIKEQSSSVSALTDKMNQTKQKLAMYDFEALQNSKIQLQKVLEFKSQINCVDSELAQCTVDIEQAGKQSHTIGLQLNEAGQQLELSKQRTEMAHDNLIQVKLRASDSVSSLRQQLSYGEECMVCGSTEHPYGVGHIDSHWQTLITDFTSQYELAHQANLELQRHYNESLSELDKVNAFLQVSNQQHTSLLKKQNTLHRSLQDYNQYIDNKGQTIAEQLCSVDNQLSSFNQLSNLQHTQWLKFKTAQESLAHVTKKQAEFTAKNQEILQKITQNSALISENKNRYDEIYHYSQSMYDNDNFWKDFTRCYKSKVEELTSIVDFVSKAKKDFEQLDIENGNLKQSNIRLLALLADDEEQLNRKNIIEAEIYSNVSKNKKLRANILPLERSADEWQDQLNKAVDDQQFYLNELQDELLQLEKNQVEHTLKVANNKSYCSDLKKQLEIIEKRFHDWLREAQKTYSQLTYERVNQLILVPKKDYETSINFYQTLKEQLNLVSIKLAHLEQEYTHHNTLKNTSLNEQELNEKYTKQSEIHDKEQENWLTLQARLKQHFSNENQVKDEQARHEKLLKDYEHWYLLDKLLGDATGKKLRNIAQTQTLKILLHYANSHLENLSQRYTLCVIGHSLNLAIIDKDMAQEQRSVNTLSGGESFLVSLALALGLASLSSNEVKISSLFIDEGFGTLDSETLSIALDALDSLQAQGRKVGVISHINEMTERVSTQIQVKKQPGGFSKVTVKG